MSWYRSGTVTAAAGQNVITGTGTQWANNVMGVAPGQALVVQRSDGNTLIYEILAVDSNTKIRINGNVVDTLSASNYGIQTSVANSYSALARETSAQLALYQQLLQDWQLITTGTGNVSIIAPDGSTVVIPSLTQISQDISNKLSVQSTFLSTDLNLAVTSGIYHPTAAAANLPIAALGVMEVYVRQGGGSLVQVYHTTTSAAGSTNRHFLRIGVSPGGVWSFSAWAEQYTSLTKPALTDLSGTLPVTSGGTGATTLAGAQSALGIVADAFGAAQVASTPWNTFTLQNGWVVLAAANYRTVYRKVLGMVQIVIAAQNGTIADGTTFSTLPTSFRPTVHDVQLIPWTPFFVDSNMPRVIIGVDGQIKLYGLTTGNFVLVAMIPIQ